MNECLLLGPGKAADLDFDDVRKAEQMMLVAVVKDEIVKRNLVPLLAKFTAGGDHLSIRLHGSRISMTEPVGGNTACHSFSRSSRSKLTNASFPPTRFSRPIARRLLARTSAVAEAGSEPSNSFSKPLARNNNS
jgi:hypothetical protein